MAKHIDYTVDILYNVFGTYDDMMLYINARTLDEWYVFMQAAMEKKKGNTLHVLAKAYIEYSRTHYQQRTALFEYQLAEGCELSEWYAQKLARFFTIIEDVLYPLLGKARRKAKRAAHVLWAGSVCVLSLSQKLELVGADSAETRAFSLSTTTW